MIRIIFNKLRNKLKENLGASGSGVSFFSFEVLGYFLLVLALFCLIVITTLVYNSRSLVYQAGKTMIQNNYSNLYHTSRESYSGGYQPAGDSFYEDYIISDSVISEVLNSGIGGVYSNGSFSRISEAGEIVYSLTDFKFELINESLGAGTQNFTLGISYVFNMPVLSNFDFSIPIKVTVKHSGKF